MAIEAHVCVYHPVFAEPIARLLRARLTRARVTAVTRTDVDPPDRDTIDVMIAHRFPAGLLGRMPRLRWLQLTSVGFDHLENEPRPPGLIVTHAGSIPCRAVAEFVMMGIFALARNAPTLVRQHDQRVWQRPGARLVAGSRLLLFGLGRIGTEVARAARANGMHVVAVTRSGATRVEAVDRCVPVDERHAMAERADYVAVCLPATPSTRGLLDATFFARLEPGAALIDVSRPGITDAAALVEALRSGRCRGAMLDVHEREPLPPEHPLWREPGVLVTPHCAFEQEREAEALGELVVRNLHELSTSSPLENVAELAAPPSPKGARSLDAPASKAPGRILASTSTVRVAHGSARAALVVGGGIAGLLAARILSDCFERVTVLERDRLPDQPDARAKTPQAPHSHVLGSIGYRRITELLPGLDQDLADAGAPRFDYFGDCRTYAGGWLPRFSSGLVSRMCTRMLLELSIRRRLSDIPNVVVRDRQRVARILVRDDGSRVTGVRLDDGSELHADLVVDAAGLGSRTTQLVRSLGFGEPEVERVDLRSATATRLFRPPPGMPTPDFVALFVRATPQNRRIGALTRIEGGLWRVSLAGLGGVYPPKSEDGFLAFTRALPSPEIHQLLREAEPVSPVYYYGTSFSRWVRYDALTRFPDGLVVVGDAAFHANPEHAQGMTFCLRAAETLGSMLAEPKGPLSERAGFSLDFQRRMAEQYRPYWVWNAAVELDVPGVVDDSRLTRRERWERVFYRHLRAVAPRDPELLRAASRVTQGEHHPSALFHPSILLRLARHTLRASKTEP